MLGGLARRTGFVQKRSEEGKPVVVVDSGDLFFAGFGTPEPDELQIKKARLLARGYMRMKVAAVNIGQRDLAAGVPLLLDLAKKGLPLISTNIMDPQGKRHLFRPYVIRQVAGLRLGFAGLMSSNLQHALKERIEGQLSVADPLAQARKLMSAHGKEADIWILLSNLGIGWERRIARERLGFSFILGGLEGRYLSMPLQERDSYIMQSYRKGMYAGVLTLAVADPKQPFKDKDEQARLIRRLKDLDRRIKALERAHQRKPSPTIAKALERVKKERAEIEGQLNSKASSTSNANLFKWTITAITSSMQEDPVVSKWIAEAGIKGKP